MEFRAGDMIRFGWETFKKRPWFLIGAFLAATVGYGIVSGAVNSVLVALIGKSGISAILESAVRFVFQMFLGIGMIRFFLHAHDDVNTATLRDFWDPKPFWRYTGASILSIAIILIGFVLLIVPGIIAMLALMFTSYLVVDRSLAPIEALKESARITKGNRMNLFLFVLAIIGISILGLICLFVGILVAVPVAALAIAHAYRLLARNAQASTLEHKASEVTPLNTSRSEVSGEHSA